MSFSLRAGEVTALVGASGSGKSTLAKMITGAEPPTAGAITFHGGDRDLEVSKLRGKELMAFRKKVQYVFQDPYAALNPARTVGYYLSRPVRNFDGLRGTGGRGTGAGAAGDGRADPRPRGSCTGSRTSCPAASGSGW